MALGQQELKALKGASAPPGEPDRLVLQAQPGHKERLELRVGSAQLVPLAAKESRFARYHTNQGVVLFISAIVCGIGGGILAFVMAFIPLIRYLCCLVMPAVWLGVLALAIIGIINAAGGKCKPLPVIGQFKLIK